MHSHDQAISVYMPLEFALLINIEIALCMREGVGSPDSETEQPNWIDSQQQIIESAEFVSIRYGNAP